jgi:hypothetical protein
MIDEQYLIINEKGAIGLHDIYTKQKSIIYDSGSTNILAFSSKADSIIMTSDHKSIRVISVPMKTRTEQDPYQYRVFSAENPYSISLHSLITLFHPANLAKWQDIYVPGYNFNLLHLLAILEPANLISIPPYSLAKVPFMVDRFGKTPFHYLLAHKSIEIPIKNALFKYMVDFIEDKQNSDHF